jgi:hypothetical protein
MINFAVNVRKNGHGRGRPLPPDLPTQVPSSAPPPFDPFNLLLASLTLYLAQLLVLDLRHSEFATVSGVTRVWIMLPPPQDRLPRPVRCLLGSGLN